MIAIKPTKILVKIGESETIKINDSSCDISFYEQVIHIKPTRISVNLEEKKNDT